MRSLILLSVSLLLLGCTSTSTTMKNEIDQNYVAAVETAAKNASVDVIWVNPPTKRAEQNHK